jgi:hypothetical protein
LFLRLRQKIYKKWFSEEKENQNYRYYFTGNFPKQAQVLASLSGGVEGLVKSLPSVNSNTELSSQYMVRGGNYDENLIYINDIELYRPFLIRNSLQKE